MRARWVAGSLWLGLFACSGGSKPPVVAATAVEICPEGKVAGPGGACGEAPASPSASATASAGGPKKFTVFERPSARGGDMGGLVGGWFGEDSDGSASYELRISQDGRYTQTITTLNNASGRSPGSCYQEGTVRLEGNQIVWSYEQNSCNTDYEGREDPDELIEQSRRHFVISMGTYQIHYNRQQ